MKTASAQPIQVSLARQLAGEWQSGPEDLLGYAQTKLRLSFAPLPGTANHVTTAMNTLSILAMAMVIYLFGGYVDKADDQPASTAKKYLK